MVYVMIMNKKVPTKVGSENKLPEQYDSLAKQYEYHAHEIIFGLIYEYTNSGDKL